MNALKPIPVRRRAFIVLNPIAGSCSTAEVRETLEREFARAGGACDIYETTGQENLSAIIDEALGHGYDLVVAAGGDGTVSNVANRVLGSEVKLGILPVGTANLLARELHIPLQVEAACRMLATSESTRRIDAMRVGDQVFISHVSLGVYSKIAERTSAAAKRYFRQIAYIWNALPELIGKRAWRFNIEVDGHKHRYRASFIMIANVGGVGAGELRWGPDIAPDDGRLDICIIRARTVTDYFLFIWHVFLNRHREAPKTTYLQARKSIKVSTRKRLPVRGDGEVVGQSHIAIEIVPHGLSIIIPEEAVSTSVI